MSVHREELYQVVDLPNPIGELGQKLRVWETVSRRPHQALGYQTPKAFYQRWLTTQTERRQVYGIYWTSTFASLDRTAYARMVADASAG